MAANRGAPRYPVLREGLRPSTSINEFRERFAYAAPGSRLSADGDVVLCGRLESRPRESSKKLFFYHLRSGGTSVQVVGELQHYGSTSSFQEDHAALREGDVVSVAGFGGRTKAGELSLIARSVSVLAPCLVEIPSGRGDGKYALRDKGVRYRQRHVDLLANGEEALRPFLLRTRAISFLRRFLEQRHFVEVETPVLSSSAGGAIATPFKTRGRAVRDELSLRIAPELYLKQLVVGGLDRVFEIGKVFRNEGVSPTHNPEFTSCEFYMAYADCEQLMALTEELLSGMALEVNGTTRLPGCEVDLKPPYRRVPVLAELERVYGVAPGAFPDVNDVARVEDTSRALSAMLAARHGPGAISGVLEAGQEPTVASNCKLLDEMIGRDIEPSCVQPSFLCDHPLAMSPLAKEHATKPGLSARFELFIKTKEVVNSYSELNDPAEQLLRFKRQLQGKGDLAASAKGVEVMPVDEEYCRVLQYGLPPTAGWGMGMDRIVMMLAGKDSIRDVILFPMMGDRE